MTIFEYQKERYYKPLKIKNMKTYDVLDAYLLGTKSFNEVVEVLQLDDNGENLVKELLCDYNSMECDPEGITQEELTKVEELINNYISLLRK